MERKKGLTVVGLALVLGLCLSPLAAEKAAAQTAGKAQPPAAAAAGEAEWDELWLEHARRTDPLRDQLWAKEMEYEAMINGGSVNMTEARALIGDMSKLRGQLRAERQNLQNRLGSDGRGWGGPGWCGGPGWRGDGNWGRGDWGRGWGGRHGGPGRHHRGGGYYR